MKKLLIPFTFCLLALAVSAQQAENTDTKANAILKSLSTKTKTYKTITGEFTFTQYGKDKKPGESQNGKLLLKGAKYKLDIKNQTTWCDSITKWTFIKDANQVQINSVDTSDEKGGLSPSTIFKFYEKGFKSHFVDEEKINGLLCQCVELYPKHPEKAKYHTIKLFIDKVKNQISQISILMKDGTTQIITIDKFTPNAPMPNSTFIFDAKNFPGVEIEDLR